MWEARRLWEKYVFSKKCLSSIPIRTLCGLCVLQSLWAFYLGILAETPNPFPSGRGYITGATAPRPCWGLRPSTPFFDNNRGFSIVCPRREFNPFPYRTFCTWSNYDSLRSAQALSPQTDTFPMYRLH